MSLIYNKTNWKDDKTTPVNAKNLNNIEDGVEYIYHKWDKIIQDSTTGDHAAELIDARYGPNDTEQHPTLGHRLNHMDNKFKEVNSQLEQIKYYLSPSKLEQSSDIYEELNKCLDECRINGGGTVIVPGGRYYLSKQLSIFDNTKLILQKDTIIIAQDSCITMLLNGSNSGCSNITVDGGTWVANEYVDGNHVMNIFAIGRGSNITIKNCTFKNVVDQHCIDIVGSEDILIENCNFEGYKNISDRYYAEAIQIGEHTQEGFGYFGPFDNKPVSNITVKNCIFKSSDIFEPWAVGVGSHTSVIDIYSSNINIVNNNFDECTYCGISFFKWKNVNIKENQFNNCDVGVKLINPTTDSFNNQKCQSGCDTYIENNKFITNTYGIEGWGSYIDSTNYDWFRNITISSNSFINSNTMSVKLSFIDNLKFNNNIVDGGDKSTIYFNIPINLVIKDNCVKNSKNDAFYIANESIKLSGMSENILIENNMIDKCAYNGLRLMNLKDVKLYNNTFKNCATEGWASYIYTKNVERCNIKNNISIGEKSEYIGNGLYSTSDCIGFRLIDNKLDALDKKYNISNEILSEQDNITKYNLLTLKEGVTNKDSNVPLRYIKTSDKTITIFGSVTHRKVNKGEYCNLELTQLPNEVFPCMTQDFITPANAGNRNEGEIPYNRIRVRGEDGVIELVATTSNADDPYTVLNGINILLR